MNKKIVGSILGLLIIFLLGLVIALHVRTVWLACARQNDIRHELDALRQVEVDLTLAAGKAHAMFLNEDPNAGEETAHILDQAASMLDMSDASCQPELKPHRQKLIGQMYEMQKIARRVVPILESWTNSPYDQHLRTMQKDLENLSDAMAKHSNEKQAIRLTTMWSGLALSYHRPGPGLYGFELALADLAQDLRSDEAKLLYGVLQKDFIKLKEERELALGFSYRVEEDEEAFDDLVMEVRDAISAYQAAGHDLAMSLDYNLAATLCPIIIAAAIAALLQGLLIYMLLRINTAKLSERS